MNGTKGFTLIELLIVIAIIAIIASIAIPNLLSARVSANETAAIATLRNISSAQAQFQGRAHNDNDADGEGEYGYFAEMSGLIGPRVDGAVLLPINPPALSGVFQNIQDVGNGEGGVTKSGFLFKMYLPGAAGAPTPEDVAGGPGAGAPDDNLAEGVWCCYAWPAVKDSTGSRAFVVNQAGDVQMTDNTLQAYNGPTTPPAGDAAFTVINDITSSLSINGVPLPSIDGGAWRPAK